MSRPSDERRIGRCGDVLYWYFYHLLYRSVDLRVAGDYRSAIPTQLQRLKINVRSHVEKIAPGDVLQGGWPVIEGMVPDNVYRPM